MKKKYPWLLSIAIIIIGVIVGSYIFYNMSQRPTFAFKPVKKGKIVSSIEVRGKILPEKTVGLSFERSGKVVAINCKTGDQVKKGAILAKIDNSDAKAQYNQAKYLLASTRSILAKDRQDLKVQKYILKQMEGKDETTYKDKQIQERKIRAYKEVVNSQESRVLASENNLKFFAYQLNKTIIKAPFAGIITEKKIEIGQSVYPIVPVITLITQDDYKIETYISQLDITKIKIGDLAKIQINNAKTKTQAMASVVAIDPMSKIVQGGTSYKVTLKFVQKDFSVKPGEEVDIKIMTQKKDNVWVIDKNSLVQKGIKNFVLVEDKNKQKELKLVKTGIKGDDNKIEITTGLKEGDKIIQLDNKN